METQEQNETIEVSESKLNRIYDKLHEFDNRISTLESENAELKREKHLLQSQIEQLEEQQQSDLEEINKEIQVLKSQAGHLAEENISINETIQSLQESISEYKDTTNKRLAQIESGASSGDDETDEMVEINGELDKIKYLDTDTIEEQFSVDIRRAVILWENFEEWSERTPGGLTLKSGDIRKLLSSHEDTQLAWTQVYRVMACFEDNTPKTYKLIDNNKTGKAIVKRL